MKPIKSTSYTQPSSSGVGVDLYNLTGNSPLDPMSTRNKELFKRKKEMDKKPNLLETIKKARMILANVSRCLFAEIGDEERSALERWMEKAKVQQGKLHLTEEQGDIVKRMVAFIMNTQLESASHERQKQIVKSILSGYDSKGSTVPGWEREREDGSKVYVLTGAQLSLIAAIYQNTKDELEKPKVEKERPFGKIKTEGPTTDEKMSKWKALLQKQKEKKETSKDEDVLDLDE